jgi:hypothetical protein
MSLMDCTISDIERSDRLVQQRAPGCYVPISSGGTHVTLSDVIKPVLDDLITTIEEQQPVATVPQAPVTLIPRIEVGVCAPGLTSIEDQWNARAKEGWGSGERGKRPKKRTRRLPQQSNKLSFLGLRAEGELHVSGVGVGPKYGWCEQCQRVLPCNELHGVHTRILCERCH